MSGKYIIPGLRKKMLEEQQQSAAKPISSNDEEAKPIKKPFSFNSKPPSASNARVSANWGNEAPQRFNRYKRDEESEEELFQKQVNSGINFEKYNDIPVSTKGKDVPPPINDFSDIKDLHLSLKKNILRANFAKPTPVQKYSLPIVIGGRDLMACAQTGSGKTAGFLFPIIHRILADGPSEDPEGPSSKTRRAYPTALILSPTRELATQIHDEARKFTYQTSIRTEVVYGGADIRYQINKLHRGCQIVVATPGRLVDLIEQGHVSLEGIKYFILDEADRMLDMGFEIQIRKIAEDYNMPGVAHRQTLMFSATFPKQIQGLASEFLKGYVFLTVGRVGSTTDFITQKFEYVDEDEKFDTLIASLKGVKDKVLVFVKTKKSADDLEQYLSECGMNAVSIHGDKQQRERELALKNFKMGIDNILVATDVAARGLDIDNVAKVINFDLPENIDDYVHRIGRTGRCGNEGIAIGFFNEYSKGIARELITLLQECNQQIPDFLKDAAKNSFMGKSKKGYGSSFGGYGSRGASRGGRGGFRGGRGGRGGFRGGFNNAKPSSSSKDEDFTDNYDFDE